MAKYVLIFHGGDMPASLEAGAQVMQAWSDWFTNLGDSVVDRGDPISEVQMIATDGTVGPAQGVPVTGYSIIQAADFAAALRLAKTCPGLGFGSTVQVAQTSAM